MHKSLIVGATLVAGLGIVASSFTIAGADNRGGIGPDVTASRVGSTNDFVYEGQSGGISAFSIASTSCNIGDEEAEWIDNAGGRNPLIAQQLYRLSPDGGRIEQVGMAWLKASFCAVSEFGNGCDPQCFSNSTCNYLAIGCADTYWAGLNDGITGRPRWEVNPVGQGTGGVHDDSNEPLPAGPSAIRGRLQVKHSDIIPGAKYFAEIQYLTHDEALERRWNNATYREVNLSTTSMSAVSTSISSHKEGSSGLQAWQDYNPSVEVVRFEDDPGVGRFELGYLVTDNGDGTWTYEYALRNHNSHRAANRFMVSMPDGVNVSNVGFHDVDYHSGDGWGGGQNFDGTDWATSSRATDLMWSTASFTSNANANALRWASLYNFRFTADTPPVDGDVTVGMYRGGGRDTVTVTALVPDAPDDPVCPTDIAGSKGEGADGETNLFDLLLLIDNWGTNGAGADIADPKNVVDLFDLLDLIDAWGTCAAK